jgi:hypothetical protein
MTRPILLTVDLATRFGWAIGPVGGVPEFGAQRTAPEGANDASYFAGMFRWTVGMIRDHGVNRVVFEAPIDPRQLGGKTNRQTGLRLIGLPAVFQAACSLCGVIDPREAKSSDVRKWLLGKVPRQPKGSKDPSFAKDRVAEGLAARGFECLDNDAADALAIWLYSDMLMRQE